MDKATQSLLDFYMEFGCEPQNQILIVEDEKLVAWDIEQTLRDTNYQEIILATSVRGAREAVEAANGRVSVAILDLKLGDADASELIDEFLSHKISVLVVTGYSRYSHPRVPVLHKPFATAALLQAVSALMSGRR